MGFKDLFELKNFEIKCNITFQNFFKSFAEKRMRCNLELNKNGILSFFDKSIDYFDNLF